MQTRYEVPGLVELVLDAARRRKWLGLFAFVAAFPAAFVAVQVLPEIYQTSATVLIENQQIPNDLVRSTVTSALDTRLMSISEEILSRSRLAELIEQNDLYPDIPADASLDSVVRRMRRDIKLDFSDTYGRAGAVSFRVGYRGKEPDKVALIANTLASFFVDENIKVREEQAAGTARFLREQLEAMQSDLAEMEKKVSAFKAAHVGELPHQQQANLSTLDQLNSRLRVNSDSQLRITERLNQLETRLAEANGGTSVISPSATRARIAELDRQLLTLRRQFSDKYPEVVRVRTELDALKNELRTEEKNIGQQDADAMTTDDPVVEAIRADISDTEIDLKALQVEAKNLQDSIERYQRRVESAPFIEQQFQVLMRDYDTTSELYRSLLSRQNEAELAERMERGQKGEQFRIIELALTPQVPAAPDRTRLRLLGLVFSLGLAAGLMYLAEISDKSFHSVDDVRSSIDVPVLVTVSNIVTGADKRRKILRAAFGLVAAVAASVIAATASYYFANGNDALVGILMR